MKTGWELKPFEEVSFIQEGPGIRKYEYEENGFPMINVRCVQDGYIDMKSSRSANMELARGKWAHFQVNQGDILFTISGTIGRCAIVKKSDLPLLMNTSVVRFRPTVPELDATYLYYYVRSALFQDMLETFVSGTAIRNVGPTHIKKTFIPLPPLEEQKRIVAILDEAFAGLDRARAHTEANLQNARDLFESVSLNELTKTSSNANIDEIADVLSGFAFKSRGYVEDNDGVRLVRGDNIIQGKFRWKKVKKWPLSEYADYSRYQLQLNDVLLAMDRTWVKAGIKYTIVSETDIPSLLVQRVARLRAKSNVIPDFLAHLIGSKHFEEYVLSIQTGLGVPHISGKQIKDFAFFLPSLETQKTITQKLNNVSKQSNELVLTYQTKLSDLDDLRQSLLQKAFAGELT